MSKRRAGFAVLGIRTVAEEAFVREDRAHVTVEIKLLSEAGAEQKDAQPKIPERVGIAGDGFHFR